MQKQNVLLDQKPSELAFELSAVQSSNFDKTQKKAKGQFFTPPNIANYMASLATFESEQKYIRILDPGCGTLILASTIIEKIVEESIGIQGIVLDCYELDLSLCEPLKEIKKYLISWAKERNIDLSINIHHEDFLLKNWDYSYEASFFDLVISNPPYFKLNKEDPRLRNFDESLSGQQNIYSLFLLQSAKLLSPNGQLIFIVPRSFTSGQYFESFRRSFFQRIDFDHVHIFDSRISSFKEEEVLQENVIISGRNKNSTNTCLVATVVSSSNGRHDLFKSRENLFRKEDIISLDGKKSIVYLPISDEQISAIKKFKSWKENLESLGFKASTGPVVPFRAKEFLISKPDKNGIVPMIWPHHCKKMEFLWPLSKTGKDDWIIDNEYSSSRTLKTKDYILIKRISSKEDNSKLTATPFFKDSIKHRSLGIENHVNYISKSNGEFLKTELIGLSVFYNSKLFNDYFRSFSGNTQVSVSELTTISMPHIETIKRIGYSYLRLSNDKRIQRNIDKIVDRWTQDIP